MLPWLNLFLEENVVGDFTYAKKNSGCGQDQEQNWGYIIGYSRIDMFVILQNPLLFSF